MDRELISQLPGQEAIGQTSDPREVGEGVKRPYVGTGRGCHESTLGAEEGSGQDWVKDRAALEG